MKPNITALKQLRRVVEDAPDDLLHMRHYEETVSCGTARCAAGWASVDPWFNEHGLTRSFIGTPMTDDNYGHSALREFFNLSDDQVIHLFATFGTPDDNDPHAVSKRQVLDQIDRIIRGEPTKPYRLSRAKRP